MLICPLCYFFSFASLALNGLLIFNWPHGPILFRVMLMTKRAFSLVELSIVLVILGLLVGGVLSGQSLIRAAELRSVSSEYSRYVAAMQTFRDKYFAAPGDMSNATAFWGKDNANCAADTGAAATPGTCNGNGDGIITYGAASATGEMHQLWKQLALAGLIEGSYSGLAGSGGGQNSIIGVNTPRSRLANAGWTLYWFTLVGHISFSDMEYGNVLFIGANNGATSAYAPIIKPEEAWNIDTKIDDGKPQRGSVMAIGWDTCTNAANSADLNGNYDLAVSTTQCALAFPKMF